MCTLYVAKGDRMFGFQTLGYFKTRKFRDGMSVHDVDVQTQQLDIEQKRAKKKGSSIFAVELF